MTSKKRTTARTPQGESLPVPQGAVRPVLVKGNDGVIRTHYLSDHGAARIDALTADGLHTLNEAIRIVVPGYVTPYETPTDPTQIPTCIIDLGLEWPCTVDDVKRRWHELAMKHHPDQGGDSAEFVIARKYYEEALSVLGAGLGGAA